MNTRCVSRSPGTACLIMGNLVRPYCPDPPRLATGLHAVPFQRSIRVRWCRLMQRVQPTAQALRADAAATPSSAAPAAVFGLCTRCQPLPFQCAMRAWPLPGSLPACPTAQAFRLIVTPTAIWGKRRAACQCRMFTARAITSAPRTSDTADCTRKVSLAHRARGMTSVGLNAVAFVKEVYR